MIKRYFVTFILMLSAGYVLFSQYQTYAQNPWTRDGQVRAHIVSITPRVTGQVTHLLVDDNSHVKQGDLLFEIDPSIYQTNYHKALASKKTS